MSLKRHAVTLLAALLVSSYAPRLYAQVRIAVVDIQRAMSETEEGRRVKAKLKRLLDRHQRQLDEKQEHVKQMAEDLEKQKNVLSEAALRERYAEYQKALAELQEQYVESQRELVNQEAELTKHILERMMDIVRRMGQSEGYTLIVERNEGGVVWVPSNLDLTDLVIQRYNAEAGGGGGSTESRSTRSSGMSKRSSSMR
jgi:outer membrane protein